MLAYWQTFRRHFHTWVSHTSIWHRLDNTYKNERLVKIKIIVFTNLFLSLSNSSQILKLDIFQVIEKRHM